MFTLYTLGDRDDGQLTRAMIIAVNLGLPPLTRADIAQLQGEKSFNNILAWR